MLATATSNTATTATAKRTLPIRMMLIALIASALAALMLSGCSAKLDEEHAPLEISATGMGIPGEPDSGDIFVDFRDYGLFDIGLIYAAQNMNADAEVYICEYDEKADRMSGDKKDFDDAYEDGFTPVPETATLYKWVKEQIAAEFSGANVGCTAELAVKKGTDRVYSRYDSESLDGIFDGALSHNKLNDIYRTAIENSGERTLALVAGAYASGDAGDGLRAQMEKWEEESFNAIFDE